MNVSEYKEHIHDEDFVLHHFLPKLWNLSRDAGRKIEISPGSLSVNFVLYWNAQLNLYLRASYDTIYSAIIGDIVILYSTYCYVIILIVIVMLT